MSFETRAARLGDLVSQGALAISDGYRVRNDELGPTGIPFVRGGDIRDGWVDTSTVDHIRPELAHRVRGKLARAGDVAFITKGTVGRAGRLRPGQPSVVFAPQVAYWRVLDRETLDPTFLFYLTRTRQFRAALDAVKSHGAMVADYVSISQQLDFTFEFPGIGSQRDIGYVLGALDDRIDLLRQTNTTLESIAQALFKSWFIDFDPVRTKQVGREPEGMDAATAALFPAEFQESELGSIPKGWTVQPIGDLVEAVGGSTPDTKNETLWGPAVHHWTSPRDLSGATAPVLLDTERKVSDAGLAKISSGLLPVGTLLMSSRAPIGYLSLSQIPVAINQGYIAMLPDGRLPPPYLYFWCQLNMGAIKARANGSTFMEISKKAFRPIPALLAPPEVIARFTDFAATVFSRVTANARQARALVELRDSLLPRLISGELRLPEVRMQTEELMA